MSKNCGLPARLTESTYPHVWRCLWKDGRRRHLWGRLNLVLWSCAKAFYGFEPLRAGCFLTFFREGGEHSPAYEGVIFSDSSFTTAPCPYPAANNSGVWPYSASLDSRSAPSSSSSFNNRLVLVTRGPLERRPTIVRFTLHVGPLLEQ